MFGQHVRRRIVLGMIVVMAAVMVAGSAPAGAEAKRPSKQQLDRWMMNCLYDSTTGEPTGNEGIEIEDSNGNVVESSCTFKDGSAVVCDWVADKCTSEAAGRPGQTPGWFPGHLSPGDRLLADQLLAADEQAAADSDQDEPAKGKHKDKRKGKDGKKRGRR